MRKYLKTMKVIALAFSLTSMHANAKEVIFNNKKIGISKRKELRPFEDLITKLSRKHHISADLVHAVVQTESNYNVNALGTSGEIGLMQIKYSTARQFGYNGTRRQLYEPANNLEFGIRYLAKAQQLSGGNLCRTVLKYNSGHAATQMRAATHIYCAKVKNYLIANR